MCSVNEAYDLSQGVHYSLLDGKCVETGDADVSYMETCPCDECNDNCENIRYD